MIEKAVILPGAGGVLRLALKLTALALSICIIVSFLSAPVNLTQSAGKPVVCSLDVCSVKGLQISNNADITFLYEPLFTLNALGYIEYRYVARYLFRVSTDSCELDHPPEN